MLAPSDKSAVEFTVPGEAVPWARSGGGRTVVRFTPARQRNYMAVLKDFGAIAMAGRPPLDGPVELSLMAVYGWPKSWSKARREAAGARWKTSRPDADNLSKIVKDALNTIVWRDDAQVASAHIWKQYGDVPRLAVRILALEGR